MTTVVTLSSTIGPLIARFLALKQAHGCRYETQRYALLQLDRFLAGRSDSDLTSESFSAWCSSTGDRRASGRRRAMQLVRQFCLYRRRSEPACFVPDASQFPPPQPRPQPHIFSEGEIARLLHTADALRPWGRSPLYGQVARVAIVLFYTSGLRRGEVVRLTLGDHDPAEETLSIRDSKFHKSRMVPLSKDAAKEIERYMHHRRQRLPRGPDAPLLLHRNAGYSGEGLRTLMRHLFHAADIRTASGRLPRVHDLRFTFAFHALLRWYRAGVDVQARLPMLATYMGHVSILSTQYYLPVLDAISEEAGERFERHSARVLGMVQEKRGGR